MFILKINKKNLSFCEILHNFEGTEQVLRETTVVILLFKPIVEQFNLQQSHKSEEMFMSLAKRKKIPLITVPQVFEQNIKVNLKDPDCQKEAVERFARNVWYELWFKKWM